MGNSSSKEQFRDAINLLSQDDIPRDDVEFWDGLWKLSTTPELVFELISPADVRALKKNRPNNLQTLFDQAVSELCRVVQNPNPEAFPSALNCVRVLTRLVPFMLEDPNDEWVKRVCWGSTEGSGSSTEEAASSEPFGRLAAHAALHLLFLPGFTVDAKVFDAASKASRGGSGDEQPEAGDLVFAVRHPGAVWAPGVGGIDEGVVARSSAYDKNRIEVLRLILALNCEPLFRPAEFFDIRLGHSPWALAATSPDVPFASLAFHSLLNVVLDFDPVGWGVPYGANASRAGQPTQLLEKAAQTLVVLLDVGANLEHDAPLIAEAVPSATAGGGNNAGGGGKAPVLVGSYTANDDEDDIVEQARKAAEIAEKMSAAQAAGGGGGWFSGLLAGSDSTENAPTTTLEEAKAKATALEAAAQQAKKTPTKAQQQAPPRNVFRELLARVGSGGNEHELRAVFDGLTRLLNNVWEAQNTYLPGSVMEIECHQEILVLLWKLLEDNPRFMPYVLKHCNVTQLVVPLCYLLFEARKDPARVGLVHICTFILLKLSGERNFCVQLNTPFDVTLPCYEFPSFQGNHADLLVLVLHKLVVNGIDKLAPLYNCFLTILCNLSPYAKSLCLLSAVKLVSLFELFTSPRFLYAAEGNHVYVQLLLETFNNVVQYQYAGNPHLVYAVVRRRQCFEKLASLTLPQARAQAELAQKRAAQPNRGIASSSSAAGAAGAAAAGGAAAAASNLDGHQVDSESANVPTSSTNLVGTTAQGEDGKSAPPLPGPATAEPAENDNEGEAASSSSSDVVPAADSSSIDSNSGAFVPTAAWLASVRSELPLTTLQRLLQHLVPQVDELVRRSQGTIDDATIMSFLGHTTMVGLLPVPHPIVIRKYTPNRYTGLWFTAFMWGVVFLNNQTMPLFDGNVIKLFSVTVAPPLEY